MYTAEMLAKRKALRDNRAVKAGIDKVELAASTTLHQQQRWLTPCPQFLSLFEWNANDTFSKPAYVGMHGKLVEALLPGTGQADAVLLAEVGFSTTPHPHPRDALRRTCLPCSYHGRGLPLASTARLGQGQRRREGTVAATGLGLYLPAHRHLDNER